MGSEVTQFKKGCVGNPAGRPRGFKGLAKKIQVNTRDGDEMLEFALSVFRGTHDAQTTFGQRWEAFQWLSDRGYGKAPQVIEVHHDEPVQSDVDMTKVSDEDLELLESAARVLDMKGVIDV